MPPLIGLACTTQRLLYAQCIVVLSVRGGREGERQADEMREMYGTVPMLLASLSGL